QSRRTSAHHPERALLPRRRLGTDARTHAGHRHPLQRRFERTRQDPEGDRAARSARTPLQGHRFLNASPPRGAETPPPSAEYFFSNAESGVRTCPPTKSAWSDVVCEVRRTRSSPWWSVSRPRCTACVCACSATATTPKTSLRKCSCASSVVCTAGTSRGRSSRG